MNMKLLVGTPIIRPKLINADAAYDTNAIREYNKDRIIYKSRSAVERFFSGIKATKKVVPGMND